VAVVYFAQTSSTVLHLSHDATSRGPTAPTFTGRENGGSLFPASCTCRNSVRLTPTSHRPVKNFQIGTTSVSRKFLPGGVMTWSRRVVVNVALALIVPVVGCVISTLVRIWLADAVGIRHSSLYYATTYPLVSSGSRIPLARTQVLGFLSLYRLYSVVSRGHVSSFTNVWLASFWRTVKCLERYPSRRSAIAR